MNDVFLIALLLGGKTDMTLMSTQYEIYGFNKCLVLQICSRNVLLCSLGKCLQKFY